MGVGIGTPDTKCGSASPTEHYLNSPIMATYWRAKHWLYTLLNIANSGTGIMEKPLAR